MVNSYNTTTATSIKKPCSLDVKTSSVQQKLEESSFFSIPKGNLSEKSTQTTHFGALKKQKIEKSNKQNKSAIYINIYQNHYIANYICNNIVDTVFKCALQNFIKSPNFLSVCSEFYILLSVIDQTNEKFKLEKFINDFADRSENVFYKWYIQKNKTDVIKPGHISNTINISKKRHISNTPKDRITKCMFRNDELKSAKEMIKGIFLNLSKNDENLSSVRMLLFSPYLELNLFKADENLPSLGTLPFNRYVERNSSKTNQSINKFSKLLKSGFISLKKEKLDKLYVNDFLTDLFKSITSDDINKVINAQFSKNFHKQAKESHNINIKAVFALTLIVSTIMTVLLFYACKLYHLNPILLTAYIIMLYLSAPTVFDFYKFHTKLNKNIVEFDSTKQDIQNFFKQKNKPDSIIDLFKNYIIMPSIEIEFIVKRNIVFQPKFHIDTDNKFLSQYLTENQNTNKRATAKSKVKKDNRSDPKVKDKGIDKEQAVSKSIDLKILNIEPKTIIFKAASNGKYPSKDILFKDLKEVYGRNGNRYFVYWDEDSIYNHRYAPIINKIRAVYDKGQEVQSGSRSQGYKGLKKSNMQQDTSTENGEQELENIFVGKNLFSHEVKAMGTISRICGFIRISPIVGHVVIFCYFDLSGRYTGH